MKVLRYILVTLGALILTTLGINAFDAASGTGESLVASALRSFNGGPCPAGMVFVGSADGDFCVDVYEVSPDDACSFPDPQSKRETDDNLAVSSCMPVSEPERVPWRNISRQQAELACARAGKRLPSSAEWQRAALGTPDALAWGREDCNLDSDKTSPEETGSRERCVSPAGAYDMIGNVWEWVTETVTNGMYDGRALPPEGYITSIDSSGMPVRTDYYTGDQSFFDDYLWIDPTDVRGVFRGGYWKSRSDGGQYALNVTVPPSFIGNAVGFRCVKDVVH